MTYLEAIIQHFGLPAGRVFPHMGAPFGGVALMIQLSPGDHGAIGRLMGDDVIRVAVSGKVETNDIVRRADLQAELIARNEELGRQQAEAWGKAQQREVQHVDVPEEEPAGIPPHVWLYRNMLTDLQALAPLGRDETNGQYAVAIDDLTEEQWYVPHILRQIALRADHYGVEARDLLPKDNTPT